MLVKVSALSYAVDRNVKSYVHLFQMRHNFVGQIKKCKKMLRSFDLTNSLLGIYSNGMIMNVN